MNQKLFYESPASCFEEAFPMGNGKLGAMVYGKTNQERISLNENTLWSGHNFQKSVPENAVENYRKAQALVLDGKAGQAEALLEQGFYGMSSQIYLPLGNLLLEIGHTGCSGYRRILDLKTAVSSVQYQFQGCRYSREYLVSQKHGCIAVHLKSDTANSVSFSVTLDSKLRILQTEARENMLIQEGVCPSFGCGYHLFEEEPFRYCEEEKKAGIPFTQAVKVTAAGGTILSENGKITVRNADSAVVYFVVCTGYRGAGLPYDKTHYDTCLQKISACGDYNAIRQAHIADYQSLYNRVNLHLTSEESQTNTLRRLEQFDGTDIGLYELLFHFGRYLLISSSRPGTEAANLQGIWNEEIKPPWRSNYTININTEMNYWPALPCNLPECFEPFISLVKKIRQTGERTAKEYYGAGGFVCHHNTDLWGHSTPVGLETNDPTQYAFWNMGSGWMACQLFDLYEYTLDTELLRETIYPIMKAAAVFYLDIMIEQDGYLMVSPSTSPENRYRTEDGLYALARTTTMSMSIVRELLTRIVQSCEILKTDAAFCSTVKAALSQLYPCQIGPDGRLLEWDKPYEEHEVTHRHISHLYSLFPGTLISPQTTPELADACRKSLLVRGDGGTGWSLGWKINLWAALGDGDHALKLLKRQLELIPPHEKHSQHGGTYPNLFDAHPPFQIDGNFGAVAGIANMLVQSRVGVIELLPALPRQWGSGSVSGLKAKGNITVSVVWENNAVVKATLLSPFDCEVQVRANGKTHCVRLTANRPAELSGI